jgi:hypothetical protein
MLSQQNHGLIVKQWKLRRALLVGATRVAESQGAAVVLACLGISLPKFSVRLESRKVKERRERHPDLLLLNYKQSVAMSTTRLSFI